MVRAHREGIVSSATLMVGFPAAAGAAELAQGCPALGLGLHLAFSGAPSLVPGSRLADQTGRLPARPADLTGADPAELRQEAEAQLRRFRELVGKEPTHLDTHHHSQRVPVVLEVVVELASRHGLPVRLASPDMGARFRAAGIATTDAFVEGFHGDGATLQGLLAVLSGLGRGSTEVMCHPAVVDAELSAGSSYVAARERELAILTSAEAREATRDVDLLTFAGAAARR